MCGTNQNLVKARIEGTVLDVCGNCAKFGEMVRIPQRIPITKRRPIRLEHKEPLQIIVPDYAFLIKNAREKKEMTQEDVSKQMAEKTSLYMKVESGQMKPSVRLAKKLEKFFHIRLLDDHEEKVVLSDSEKGRALTIGDLIKRR